jgi:hypothetical protein
LLQQLGQHIAVAKERARLYRESAAAVSEKKLKADLVELEKAWLELAASFEALKSREDFLIESAKRKGLAL